MSLEKVEGKAEKVFAVIKRVACAKGGIHAFVLASAGAIFIHPLAGVVGVCAGFLIGRRYGHIGGQDVQVPTKPA